LQVELDALKLKSRTQKGGWCYFIVDMIFQEFVFKYNFNMNDVKAECYSDLELIKLKNAVCLYTEKQEKKKSGKMDILNEDFSSQDLFSTLGKKVKDCNELWSFTYNDNNAGPTRTLVGIIYTENKTNEIKPHAMGLIRCPPKVEKGVLKLIDPNQIDVITITDFKHLQQQLLYAGSLLSDKGTFISEIFYKKYIKPGNK